MVTDILRILPQGALAPVAASAALFGAYLLVKWLPDLNLQTLFDAYFWLVGAVAVASGIAQPLRRTVRPRKWLVGSATHSLCVKLIAGLLVDVSALAPFTMPVLAGSAAQHACANPTLPGIKSSQLASCD